MACHSIYPKYVPELGRYALGALEIYAGFSVHGLSLQRNITSVSISARSQVSQERNFERISYSLLSAD